MSHHLNAFNTTKRFQKEQDKQQIADQKLSNKILAHKAQSLESCTECKQNDLVIKKSEGIIVCQNCGLVQQQRIIDESSEWRNFSSESGSSGVDPNRVGGPINPLLEQSGISTVVGGGNQSELSKFC